MTVEFEDLDIRIPANGYGLLLAQPHVELSANEPFRWEGARRQVQLEAVSRVLALATQPPLAVGPIHFTVFPEFSIPGLDGIARIEEAMAAGRWSTGTVVIAGIDGLTKAEYEQLCNAPMTRVATANAPANIAANQWVNCCVVFVKAGDGQVSRWIQPKLAPAELEWRTSYSKMFPGQVVHVFRAEYDNQSPFMFFAMICFDWIARSNGHLRWREVLDAIDVRAREAGGIFPISAVFIPQHNEEPSHNLFLQSTVEFLSHPGQYASVKRDGTCAVLFANTAGRSDPGKCDKYGRSAIVYSMGSFGKCDFCPPSYSASGGVLRKTNALGNCIDVIFREWGECIHVCKVIPPQFLDRSAAGKSPPLSDAHVFRLREGVIDPRLPDAPVVAAGKWVHDELDEIHNRPGSAPAYRHQQLRALMTGTHVQNRDQLRSVSGEVLAKRMHLAGVTELMPDLWGPAELDALEHMVNTLDIIGLGRGPLDLCGCLLHGVVSTLPQRVELLAVRRETYEDCKKAADRHVAESRSKTVVVCRDAANSVFLPEFVSAITQPPAQDGGEDLLNADVGLVFKGYQDILTCYITSQTEAALQEALDAHLNS